MSIGKSSRRNGRNQRGFSLAEFGLALALALVMMAVLATRNHDVSNNFRAKAVAQSMTEFSKVAYRYLVNHQEGVLAAAKDGTEADKYCVINADYVSGVVPTSTITANIVKHTCAIDVSWLKHKRMLPQDFPSTNPYGQKWVAIYRVVYADYDYDAGTAPTTNGDMEMLVVASNSGGGHKYVSVEEAMLAASIVGVDGGIIPSVTTGACAYEADNPNNQQTCSVMGGWRVNLKDFVD